MTQLLIDEPPLQVLPSLATLLHSSDKALILQQLHYWLQRSTNVKDGYKWVYNSYENWHKQFPWMTSRTVKNHMDWLEKHGYIVSGNYNKAKFDRTKWYRIDYDAFEKNVCAFRKDFQMNMKDFHNADGKVFQTNTNRLPETTTKTNKKIHCRADARPGLSEDVKTIIDYLNEKTNKHFKATTNKTKSVIKARLNEGFTLDDFKKVIDNKTTEWLNDRKMNKFLRPETLFSNKFEGYLNETPKRPRNYHSEYDNIF